MTDVPRRYRVLHAPYDVGGNSYYLAKAQCDLGFDARTLVYFKQWFGYPADSVLRVKAGANPLRYPQWWAAMAKVALTTDVLHFNFGGSFLTDVNRGRVFTDLALWKRLNIATFVSFQGCDSRISSYCLDQFPINACANCRSRPFCHDTYNAFKQETISQVGRYFDGVFAVNPDLLRNIPNGRFLPYSNCDLDEWLPPQGYDHHHAGPVRILHAPTWREIKGTDHIIQAVEELRNEGENVELVLVEKVPHGQVKSLYASCDLLVDQVLIGWYGGLAVELMALGKPVVAYIRQSDLAYIPAKMREELPVVSAEPATLKDVLRPLIRDANRRQELGARARRFAENWHHPQVVARMTTDLYKQALERRQPAPDKVTRLRTLWTAARPAARTLGKLYLAQSPIVALFRRVARRLGPKLFRLGFLILLPLIWLCSWIRQRRARPASLWGTTPILTIPLLANADRELGFKSKTLVYTVYHITSQFDYVLKNKVDWLCRRAPSLLTAYYRLVFLSCLLRYDVFHFFCDAGILERDGRFGVNRDELRLLRRAGKRVYLYAYGADIRTRAATQRLGKFHCCLHCDKVGGHCICNDAEGEEKQAFYRANTTAVVSMGDMMEYVPEAKNLYYWPFDSTKIAYSGIRWNGQRPLKILHVPNHEWARGSQYLRRAIESLSRQGIQFELIQARGVPNARVLELIREADIVADQFLIGWHGYTALEALAAGKMVLCYIRDRSMLLDAERCPIVSANPDTLEQVLSDIAQYSPDQMSEIGQAGREYVERNYSCQAVAARLGGLYLETASFPRATRKSIERNLLRLTDLAAAESRRASVAGPHWHGAPSRESTVCS